GAEEHRRPAGPARQLGDEPAGGERDGERREAAAQPGEVGPLVGEPRPAGRVAHLALPLHGVRFAAAPPAPPPTRSAFRYSVASTGRPTAPSACAWAGTRVRSSVAPRAAAAAANSAPTTNAAW